MAALAAYGLDVASRIEVFPLDPRCVRQGDILAITPSGTFGRHSRLRKWPKKTHAQQERVRTGEIR
jgi:hypothetical protein